MELERREFPYFTEYELDFKTDFAFHSVSSSVLTIFECITDISQRVQPVLETYLIEVYSGIGLGTRRIFIILNALSEVGAKQDGGLSWYTCGPKVTG